ncbi:uncharacterized protein LOC125238785 [Leguminivora glycinivorella]|uniref:uncharacterized protein LOC125238785 n=1 Tax=Leguminivora glycinivorella TaxID=1035111 RepID=UPI00200DFE39|nr:uncharacterized protein LOC125238785 [Leguminivora glycinivorella]
MWNNIVCVLLIHGLFVNAFPANEGVGINANDKHLTVPIRGKAEFSGTAPASGRAAFTTHTPCPEVTLPFIPNAPENGPLPKNIMLGATLADAILAEAGREIDAKLAEIDAFVENELERMGPQLQVAMKGGATSDIESALDSTLQKMESEISTELSNLDKFIDSELEKAEEVVKSALRKVESEMERNNNAIGQTVTKQMTEQEALTQLAMLILQAFVESKLAETENVVKSDLEKVNAFVNKELQKVDATAESRTGKIYKDVEKELEKTDTRMKSEVSEIESRVRSKLDKTESLVESESDKVGEFLDAQLAKTETFVDMEIAKIKSVVEAELLKVDNALDGVNDCCTMYSNSVPMMQPVPLYLQSYPACETLCYESCTPMLPYTGFTPPIIGTPNPTIALNPVPYDSQCLRYNTQCAAPVLYHRTQLPAVNVIQGTARAVGNIKLFAQFPCPPLEANQIGPDGKKYIWIKKKSADEEKPSRRKLEFPDFSEFPEAATEAYEKLHSDPDDRADLPVGRNIKHK